MLLCFHHIYRKGESVVDGGKFQNISIIDNNDFLPPNSSVSACSKYQFVLVKRGGGRADESCVGSCSIGVSTGGCRASAATTLVTLTRDTCGLSCCWRLDRGHRCQHTRVHVSCVVTLSEAVDISAPGTFICWFLLLGHMDTCEVVRLKVM